MTEIEALLKATIGEMERLLASKTVIGEPITAEGKTVIPLLSVGAGFGMRPVAVIVIEEDAVRVEPIRKGGGSIIEQLADKVPQLIKKEIDEREERKQKESAEKSGGEKGKGKEIKVE
jgi:uncharacterized spore protein YtfJ